MLIIAFKRNGASNPALHPQYITEWGDASCMQSHDGYECAEQDDFCAELALNEARQAEHAAQYKTQCELAKRAKEQAELFAFGEDKALAREFELFKRWKKSKGSK